MARENRTQAVVGDPLEAGGRVDLGREVGGVEAVAAQPSRRHEDEYAEDSIGEPKAGRRSGLRPGLAQRADQEIDVLDGLIDRLGPPRAIWDGPSTPRSSSLAAFQAGGGTGNSAAPRARDRAGCRSRRDRCTGLAPASPVSGAGCWGSVQDQPPGWLVASEYITSSKAISR